jgi:alpha,alpha-trehalase
MLVHVLHTLVFALVIGEVSAAQGHAPLPTVHIKTTLERLLTDEDTDGDLRITIDDPHVIGTDRGDKRFWISPGSASPFEIAGTYYLSNLLQELKLAEESGKESVQVAAAHVFEPPVARITRMIRQYFWDGLTRRMDEVGLMTILKDEKTISVDGYAYVYVPSSDVLAYRFFSQIAKRHPERQIRVARLPQSVDADYVRRLDGRHGILSLAFRNIGKDSLQAVPFVVPGGRFNEMYGWDSYFIVLGLLTDGRIDLAKAMVENFVYELEHYGKILNANRTYYLTRSQPPFFTSMIRAVYAHLPKSSESRSWLRRCLIAAMKEYLTVWTSRIHTTDIGLARYFDTGFGPPPEVESGHFDAVFAQFARAAGMDPRQFEQAYRSGTLRVPELDRYFVHDRAMRESGHDTSYRLEGRCANLATVDLNALLFKYEEDIAAILDADFGGTITLENGTTYTSSAWRERSAQRKELMNRYLWDSERGMFFDYDVVERRNTGYVSATTFFPMWAGMTSAVQAESLVKRALPMLEQAGGVAGSSEESRGELSPERPQRQWDYPYGWAPHQIIIWQALLNYGFEREAQRLIYKWLYTLTVNAVNYNGTIPEKFDVVRRTHQVFAEYGNVGTTFSYITREGFGWTNASYQVGLSYLPPRYQALLNNLIPPEWVENVLHQQ